MNWIEPASAATSAVAAIVAVSVAGWSIFEGRRLFNLQTSPEIIVYMERNSRFPDAADLVIANIGSAPAVDVHLDWPKDIEFFGLYEGQRDHIFILDNGIKLFAPGQRFSYSVGIFSEMDKSDVSIQVSYYRKGDEKRRKKMIADFLIRPRELDGMAEWNNREKEAQISIKKAMDALTRGRISVKVKTVDERPTPKSN